MEVWSWCWNLKEDYLFMLDILHCNSTQLNWKSFNSMQLRYVNEMKRSSGLESELGCGVHMCVSVMVKGNRNRKFIREFKPRNSRPNQLFGLSLDRLEDYVKLHAVKVRLAVEWRDFVAWPAGMTLLDFETCALIKEAGGTNTRETKVNLLNTKC